MSYFRASRTYTQIDLQSASKTEILDRLYQRLLRDLDLARQAIEQHQFSVKAKALGHAHQIVAELELALDFTVAHDLCTQLRELYAYVEDRLYLANQECESVHLDNAAKVIVNLRDSYRIAASQVHESAA